MADPSKNHVGGVPETGTPVRDEPSFTPSSETYQESTFMVMKTGVKQGFFYISNDDLVCAH